MQTQYSVLHFRTGFYFNDYKPETEVDENGHGNINTDYEVKNQKALKQELGCQFITIYPEKKTLIFLKLSVNHLDMSNNRLINRLNNHIKTVIDTVSVRSLRLKFKSNNVIISKAIEFFVKNILPGYASKC